MFPFISSAISCLYGFSIFLNIFSPLFPLHLAIRTSLAQENCCCFLSYKNIIIRHETAVQWMYLNIEENSIYLPGHDVIQAIKHSAWNKQEFLWRHISDCFRMSSHTQLECVTFQGQHHVISYGIPYDVKLGASYWRHVRNGRVRWNTKQFLVGWSKRGA